MIATLRRRWSALDRYLLLHRPQLWMSRAHYFVLGAGLTAVLIVIAAIVHPLSISDVPDPTEYLWIPLAVVGVEAAVWLGFAFRAQSGSPLRTGLEGWLVPLGFAIGLVALATLPFGYVAIIRGRVTELVSDSTLQHEAATLRQSGLSMMEGGPVSLAGRADRLHFDELPDSIARHGARVLGKYAGLPAEQAFSVGLVIATRDRLVQRVLELQRRRYALRDSLGSEFAVPVAEMTFAPPRVGLDSVLKSLAWIRLCFDSIRPTSQAPCPGPGWHEDRSTVYVDPNRSFPPLWKMFNDSNGVATLPQPLLEVGRQIARSAYAIEVARLAVIYRAE